MKGKGAPTPDSTRVCLSAIMDIFIRRASKAETQWGNTNQPTRADSEESDCQEVCYTPPPPSPLYNTQMDCHIRFRCIGYYTLGLRFPTHPSGLSLRTRSSRCSESLISWMKTWGTCRLLPPWSHWTRFGTCDPFWRLHLAVASQIRSNVVKCWMWKPMDAMAVHRFGAPSETLSTLKRSDCNTVTFSPLMQVVQRMERCRSSV